MRRSIQISSCAIPQGGMYGVLLGDMGPRVYTWGLLGNSFFVVIAVFWYGAMINRRNPEPNRRFWVVKASAGALRNIPYLDPTTIPQKESPNSPHFVSMTSLAEGTHKDVDITALLGQRHMPSLKRTRKK